MNSDFSELYSRYNDVLKPLVSEIEGRLEQFEEPLLKNLFYFFDSLVLAASVSEKDKAQYLFQGSDYLDTCISVSYQYLIYSLEIKVLSFEKQTRNVKVELFEDGHFIGKFADLKQKAEGAVRNGVHTANHVEGLPFYQEAYMYYLELEKMVDKQNPNLISCRKTTSDVEVFQWVSGVAASVLAGCYHAELKDVVANLWNYIM